jgi:hypothetical protein
VIKDTLKNVAKICISDIFLLKLYYKQLTPTTKGKTQCQLTDTHTKSVICSQQARQALQVVSQVLHQCLTRLPELALSCQTALVAWLWLRPLSNLKM